MTTIATPAAEDLRAQLNERMERLDVRIGDLAEATGLSRQTVSGAVRGTTNTTDRTFKILFAALDDIEADREAGPTTYASEDRPRFRMELKGDFAAGLQSLVFEGDDPQAVRAEALAFMAQLGELG